MSIYSKPIPAILRELGERLRRARLKANLTQQALADSASVSLKTVANAEDGQNVSVETLLLLLRGVGRLDDIQSLLADEGPSPIELARRQGKARQRASGKRSQGKSSSEDWQW
ncbi:MAG: helix-turn-helix domain-containing protein [Gammaproteobacteria bacterium]|nr:helix-turn-helix domain-containing protein [Gammaproteobacteria bacterium]